MDFEDEENEIPAQVDVVDPAVRAHIYSLATALGGNSLSSNGAYELGDDALACLKDLKRWLRGYDEKLNRLDVARCMAEANLISGDLLPILANLPTFPMEESSKLRLALACVELLVPLTWPLEKDDSSMTKNHHRHMAYLQHSQFRYKADILQHRSHTILDACIRVVLPSMAAPKKDRSLKDEGIIRLVLYLMRNIAKLERVDADSSEATLDISRSTTIITFDQQNIFRLILTIASGLGKGFDVQDVMVLEILYYLLRGLNAKDIFMTQAEQLDKSQNELKAALDAEKRLKRDAAKHAPTRHNRFGTTIWLEKGGGKRAVISGQAPLHGNEKSLQKMDSEKKWRRAKPRERIDSTYRELNRTASLTSAAQKCFRQFVGEFIDSCFNPFFDHLRRAMERDSDRILSDTHPRQYCYVMSWFLQAQRERKIATKSKEKANSGAQEDDFSLIAAVLKQETSILLTKYMNESLELKAWGDIQAGCLCWTQMLLTVQEMANSSKEDNQDDAENIQNRLFYEESSQEMIIRLVRNYERQPIQYLDAITELASVHIRMLEKYSKRNTSMVTRTKRNRRRKAETASADPNDSEEETESRQTVAERQFSFTNFEARYLSQTVVNTFVSLLSFYRELSYSQIKKAITFLHRIFVKREMEMLLYRMDIVELLSRIAGDSAGLPSSHKAYAEVHQFVKYFSKRLTSKLKERPSLFVELLFSKIPRTVWYLQTGEQAQKAPKKPKKVVELEVKPGYSYKDQVGIVMSALDQDDREGFLKWLEATLRDAINERKAWEAADAAVVAQEAAEAAAAAEAAKAAGGAEAMEETGPSEAPDPPKRTVQYPVIDLEPKQNEHKKYLASDQKVILLMKLLGCKRSSDDLENTEATWTVPPETTTEKLEEMLQTLLDYMSNPKVFEDGTEAADLLRKKRKPRQQALYTSDEDEEGEFAPNLKGLSRKADYEKKRKGRKRNRGDDEGQELLDDSEAERKAEIRRKKNAEKNAKIKSALFISKSDDEEEPADDQEFFEREKKLQADMEAAMKHTSLVESDDDILPEREPKKVKRITYLDESDDNSDGGNKEGNDGYDDEDADDDDPVSSTAKRKVPMKKKKTRARNAILMDSDDDDEVADGDDDDGEKGKITQKRKQDEDGDEEIEDAADPSDDE